MFTNGMSYELCHLRKPFQDLQTQQWFTGNYYLLEKMEMVALLQC